MLPWSALAIRPHHEDFLEQCRFLPSVLMDHAAIEGGYLKIVEVKETGDVVVDAFSGPGTLGLHHIITFADLIEHYTVRKMDVHWLDYPTCAFIDSREHQLLLSSTWPPQLFVTLSKSTCATSQGGVFCTQQFKKETMIVVPATTNIKVMDEDADEPEKCYQIVVDGWDLNATFWLAPLTKGDGSEAAWYIRAVDENHNMVVKYKSVTVVVKESINVKVPYLTNNRMMKNGAELTMH